MSIKQLSRRQAQWSEFLSRFDYRITYRPDKTDGKPDALTRRSGDFSKEGNTFDPRHLHQHQTILKTHVLDLKIVQDLQCQAITLDPVQLHLSSIPSASLVTLVPMKLDVEELNVDDVEPQLDQGTSGPNEDSADTSTQTLWDQVEVSDQFASQVLEALRSEARHHNRIPLVECEERFNCLYFRGKKYVSNSNRLRLRVIQLAHNSVVDDHSGRTKCYELISRAYWWSNIYKYIQRFVRNCHTCTRFKPSRQKTQEWLRSLPVPERRWRDVFMNYVGPLSSSTFMSITYRYVLVFVDRLIKIRHLVLITSMKVEKAVNCFYVYVWKHHELLKSFVSDRGTQFISDVWEHLCQMLKIDVKLFTAYHHCHEHNNLIG